jgi:hypothetical protein
MLTTYPSEGRVEVVEECNGGPVERAPLKIVEIDLSDFDAFLERGIDEEKND